MAELSIDDLSSQYFDVLKEIGNIGAGNATTALSTMLGCKIFHIFVISWHCFIPPTLLLLQLKKQDYSIDIIVHR